MKRVLTFLAVLGLCSYAWAQEPTEPVPEPGTQPGTEPDPEAPPEEVQACLSASERGQDLRDKTELLAAREAFLQCTREICPKVVRDDCIQWMNQVESAIPSIVPGARDRKGRDLVVVSFYIDGKLVTQRLDGKPIALDPGPHTLRWQNVDGLAEERRFVIRQGEKSRAVSVTLGPMIVKPRPPRPKQKSGGVPAVSWVLGGAGVAGIVIFAGVAVWAKNEYNDLATSCAPNCAESQVDAVRDKLYAANISLGIGVASLIVGVGLAFALQPDSDEPESATLVVGPNGAAIRASFY